MTLEDYIKFVEEKKSASKHKLTQVGLIEATNTKIVVGVFEFYDTLGMPLVMVLDALVKNNIMPCWTTFILTARKNGWLDKTIKSRLNEAIVDAYDPKFRDEVFARAKKFGILE